MSNVSNVDVVQKLWGFCHTLRHDGIDYGDYIEQITYLLFLKMADERAIDLSTIEVTGKKGKVEVIDCSWPTLAQQSGTALTEHYIEILRALGQTKGILGDIYSGAQSRFNNPVNLKKLISLIDETQWISLDVDVKAAAYEGLLEKAAAEGKKGAGQYFTPRIVIQSICRCMKPDPRTKPDFTVCDPAAGSGGFLVSAYEWLRDETKGALDRQVAKRVKTKTYFGEELVARPRRMSLMNLFLHNIEPHIRLGDSIAEPPSPERFDVILTNPPFGTKGAGQAPERDDFTVSTSNKQLNFLQHVLTILKPGGRAAVVLPDNVLFADQAGEVMKIIAEDCDLHTVLRLPRGTFTPYSQGVKANVIFFTKGYATEKVWIYDARTNVPGITKKDRPLTRQHFKEFEKCYGAEPNGKSKRKRGDSKEDRWHDFHILGVHQAQVNRARRRLDRVPAVLKRFRQSVLAAACSGELTREWREATPTCSAEADLDRLAQATGPAKTRRGVPETVGLPESLSDFSPPQGWAVRSVASLLRGGALLDVKDGNHGANHPTVADFTDHGVPFITAAQVGRFTIDYDGAYRVSGEPLKKLRVGFARKGDAILTHKGSVGRTALCTRDCVLTPQTTYYRTNTSVIDPEYLVYWFASPQFYDELAAVMSQTTRDFVPISEQYNLFLVLPPIDEQRAIVGRLRGLLAVADNIERRVQQAIARADKLPQAILSKAFSGELVPTEAELARAEGRTYETAEALLRRVTQASADQGGRPSGVRARRSKVDVEPTPTKRKASRS